MSHRNIIAVGCMLVSLSVALGAFAAHGLKHHLEPYYLQIFEKAVYYQTLQALGMVVSGVLAALNLINRSTFKYVSLGMLLGMLIFSGSLYCLVLTQQAWFGAITPIGGVFIILSWLGLGVGVANNRSGTVREE